MVPYNDPTMALQCVIQSRVRGGCFSFTGSRLAWYWLRLTKSPSGIEKRLHTDFLLNLRNGPEPIFIESEVQGESCSPDVMYVCTFVKWVANGTPLPAGCTARRGARCTGANVTFICNLLLLYISCFIISTGWMVCGFASDTAGIWLGPQQCGDLKHLNYSFPPLL